MARVSGVRELLQGLQTTREANLELDVLVLAIVNSCATSANAAFEDARQDLGMRPYLQPMYEMGRAGILSMRLAIAQYEQLGPEPRLERKQALAVLTETARHLEEVMGAINRIEMVVKVHA